MRSRLKTLVLDSNGFGWKEYAADTLILGVLRREQYPTLPAALRRQPLLRGLKSRYDALSYVKDWRDALQASPSLDVRVCNVTNLVEFAKWLRRVGEFDLVVVLHATAGDSMTLLLKVAERMRPRHGRLVVFIGNEYDLMPEKMEFLRRARADYVCTQLPIESARWLYAECEGIDVLAMPHALNPDVYHPASHDERRVDLGFIGAFHPLFIGDIERTRLVREVELRCRDWRLACDIREHNVPRPEWADFLRRSKGSIGGESGTYYLDRRGTLIGAAKEFVSEHPTATIEDLSDHVFANPRVEYVSGKCISSRHFEAIGTKTCQILLEGKYNGLLQAGDHYITVKKDLSDLDDAITAFKDVGFRAEIVDRAYEYVLDRHTYAHRVDSLLTALGAA
jgi:Glycosyl transferases group 1